MRYFQLPSGIRATVLGASQYTVQVSGSTIYLSSPGVVPVRNVQVVAPQFSFSGDIDEHEIEHSLCQSIMLFDLAEHEGPLGIAFAWDGMATYDRLGAFARGILTGLKAWHNESGLIVLLSSEDVGGLLGLGDF